MYIKELCIFFYGKLSAKYLKQYYSMQLDAN